MARKPKRMALYEAIRQGQIKIADGLKNGQMRSDGQRQSTQKVKPVSCASPTGGQALLRSEEKKSARGTKPSRMTMIMLGIAAQVLILGLGIWLGILFMGSDDEPVQASKSPDSKTPAKEMANSAANDEENSSTQSGGFFWNRKRAEEEAQEPSTDSEQPADKKEVPEEPQQPAREVLPTGKNVIAIQSITPSRQNELNPLVDYFKTKGIETTIITDPASGYAVLVTKAGFKRNPGVRGTEGYALYNRIRQLGLSFVDETENTDFGTRPFQDIYGYKIK